MPEILDDLDACRFKRQIQLSPKVEMVVKGTKVMIIKLQNAVSRSDCAHTLICNHVHCIN